MEILYQIFYRYAKKGHAAQIDQFIFLFGYCLIKWSLNKLSKKVIAHASFRRSLMSKNSHLVGELPDVLILSEFSQWPSPWIGWLLPPWIGRKKKVEACARPSSLGTTPSLRVLRSRNAVKFLCYFNLSFYQCSSWQKELPF